MEAQFPPEAPAAGPGWLGWPLIHLFVFVLPASRQGYARSWGWLTPTRGFPELRFPAFLRDPSAASEWHLALGCRTAALSCSAAPAPHARAAAGHGPGLGQLARATPAQTGAMLSGTDGVYHDAMAQPMPVSNSSKSAISSKVRKALNLPFWLPTLLCEGGNFYPAQLELGEFYSTFAAHLVQWFYKYQPMEIYL